MIQVRRGTFETNSSSTHSITMCMKDDYDKWMRGEMYLLDEYNNSDSEFAKKSFVTLDEAVDIIAKDRYDPVPRDQITLEFLEKHAAQYCMYPTFEAYEEANEWMKTYVETFTTPKGDEIVAFGYYGHD